MYVPGDHWKICDECGFRARASQAHKRWDGAIVCLADFEPRHPQDFVRGRKDHQNVTDPRPEPVDNIIGPLQTVTTSASLAGTSVLTVVSSVRFVAGDRIGMTVSDGSLYRATVGGVPDTQTINLIDPLPSAVPIGSVVIDYSAVSQPSLG